MTTQEPHGGGPQDPVLSHQPQHDPTTQIATATAPAKKVVGLALSALIVGVVAFLVGLIPVFGALVGIAAVVLGVLALRKGQSKGMSITGIVLGAIAVLASIGMTAGIGAAVNNASTEVPVAVASPSETSEEETGGPSPEPEETAPAPEETVAPEPEVPAVPVEYSSALTKAANYSDNLFMSKAGLYDQLTSEYGEQFSAEASQYAVDNVQADWNANALAKAKSYQEQMAMSPEAIRDQLTSEFGEKFTAAEADFAIQHLND